MSCENVQKRISLLLDRKLPARERENMLAHIEACHECELRFDMMQNQIAMVRGLGQPAIPDDLKARLSVLASHECERAATRVSLSARLKQWASSLELEFDNLMRPVALPFTGGVLSSLLIFALLVPNVSFSRNVPGQEFFTAPSGTLVNNPADTINPEVTDAPRIVTVDAEGDYVNVVALEIDESGKVVDWSILKGQLTEDMKSIIVWSRFQPATTFGVKTSGTITIGQGLPPCKLRQCSATVRG
jgi:Putative zinc-finger